MTLNRDQLTSFVTKAEDVESNSNVTRPELNAVCRDEAGTETNRHNKFIDFAYNSVVIHSLLLEGMIIYEAYYFGGSAKKNASVLSC